MQSKTLVVLPQGKVWATRQQADTLEALVSTRKGGFARVYGYRPSSNYIKQPVQDIVMVTRFSTEKLYQRKRKALNSITFVDVKPAIDADDMLSNLPLQEQKTLFAERLQEMVDSMSKTLDGDRSDAHRQAHDRCYLHIDDGIKVNFETVKVAGKMQPVITDGFPTVASIMITYLENSKVTRVAGERKYVNSGAPKRMSNAIESVLNKRSVGIKTLSLKEDNFERLVIDNEVILSEDVVGLVD